MKISELLEENNESPFERFGIVVDKLSSDIVKNITKIGIVATPEEKNESGFSSISFDVLDTVIAYVSTGVDVILEVEFESKLSPNDTVILAMNCGIELSILPPVEINDQSLSDYTKVLCDYATALLSQPNCDIQIYPVAGYFQYLIASVFGFVPSTISDDQYTSEKYTSKMSIEQMDSVKDILKAHMYSIAGGEDKFEIFAHTIYKAVTESMINIAK